MITKTLRNKIAAGVVAVSLVGGAGTVFASPDAAGQLNTWYSNQLTASVTQVSSDVLAYAGRLQSTLESFFNGTKDAAVKTVKDAGKTEVATANTNINNYVSNYETDITKTAASIQGGMDKQFKQLTTTLNGMVDTYAAGGQTWAQARINEAVDTQKTTSLNEVNTQVTATKDAAVDDLTLTINNAKKDINAQIATDQAAATKAINGHIDDAVTAGKAAIKADTDKYTQSSVDTINAAGKTIEDAAKTAMDQLVTDITK